MTAPRYPGSQKNRPNLLYPPHLPMRQLHLPAGELVLDMQIETGQRKSQLDGFVVLFGCLFTWRIQPRPPRCVAKTGLGRLPNFTHFHRLLILRPGNHAISALPLGSIQCLVRTIDQGIQGEQPLGIHPHQAKTDS